MSTNTNCASALGHDADDAVARRLRLLRRDADLLADERVEQRRLADARPADDRDVAAAKRRRCGASAARARRPDCAAIARERLPAAAACSAARRLRAGARWSTIAERRNAAFDVERLRVRFAAGRRRPRTPAPASRRACSHSCSRVFGSLPSAAGSASRKHVAVARARSPRAPPRSRRRGTRRRTPPRAHRRGSTAARRRRSCCSPSPSTISRPSAELARDAAPACPG